MRETLEELLALARSEDLGEVAGRFAQEIDSLREQLVSAEENAAEDASNEYWRGYDNGREDEKDSDG